MNLFDLFLLFMSKGNFIYWLVYELLDICWKNFGDYVSYLVSDLLVGEEICFVIVI